MPPPVAATEPHPSGRRELSARRVLALWALLLAVLAAVLHLPGHVSYDTSIQLLEAARGASRSWNPPFMSALLQALGGGSAATGGFVLSCTAMTYAGLVLAVPPVPAAGHRARIAVAMVVMANPVLLLYSGIVWKDVLFGALLCLACGSTLAAGNASGSHRRWCLALLAAAAIVVAAHVRQQGLVLLPILALLPLLAVHGPRRPPPRHVLAWIAGLALAFLAVGQWAAARVAHEPGWDRERGIQRILAYDIVGTLARAGTPRSLALAGELGGREAIREAYDPSRIDHIRRVPAVASHFDDVRTARLRSLWANAVGTEPGAYLRHRAGVAAHVFGFTGLEACLPMHVGVAGDPVALAAAGLSPGVDARDRWLLAASRALRDTPWYRHWFTLLALLTIVAVSANRRGQPGGRTTFWFALAATGHGLATAAFAIACDFRYLYPSITIASSCAVALLFRSRTR